MSIDEDSPERISQEQEKSPDLEETLEFGSSPVDEVPFHIPRD